MLEEGEKFCIVDKYWFVFIFYVNGFRVGKLYMIK